MLWSPDNADFCRPFGVREADLLDGEPVSTLDVGWVLCRRALLVYFHASRQDFEIGSGGPGSKHQRHARAGA